MSTDYTDNYQLCQWVKSDQVLMEEFNQDNLRTDQALFGLAQTLETKAGISEVAGLASQISQINGELDQKADTAAVSSQISQINTALGKKADSSTVTALSNTVKNKADSSTVTALSEQLTAAKASIPKVAVGSYVGDGQESRTISLSFAPKMVLVFLKHGYTYYSSGNQYHYGGMACLNKPAVTGSSGGTGNPIVEIAGSGFKVYCSEQKSGNFQTCVETNAADKEFYYFAIG